MTEVAPYTGIRAMGLGASGESLAGWSTTLGTSVVIKRYEPTGADDDLEQLLDELDRWFALRNEGLVMPIEGGSADDGGVFIARPFIAGQPAASWIKASPRPQRPEILTLLCGVAQTLASLHRCGVSHGAVSAANIIVVTADGDPPRAVITDPRPQRHLVSGPNDEGAGPNADTANLAAVAAEMLVGHPLPATVDQALVAALGDDVQSRPTMLELGRAFSAGAMVMPSVTAPPPVPPSAEPTRIQHDTPDLPAAGTFADDIEALRNSAPGPERRGVRWIGVALGMTVAVAALSGGIWVAATNPERQTTTAVTVKDEVQLAVSRAEFNATTQSRIDVTITATIASANPEVLSCPGRDCSIQLLLGRRGARTAPGAAGVIKKLSIDSRLLGVTTSPRRGSVDLLSPTSDPESTVDPLRSPAGTTRLVFTVADGTEILGVAAVGDRSTILGFSDATVWPGDRN